VATIFCRLLLDSVFGLDPRGKAAAPGIPEEPWRMLLTGVVVTAPDRRHVSGIVG
jgi:hypothetical protein